MHHFLYFVVKKFLLKKTCQDLLYNIYASYKLSSTKKETINKTWNHFRKMNTGWGWKLLSKENLESGLFILFMLLCLYSHLASLLFWQVTIFTFAQQISKKHSDIIGNLFAWWTCVTFLRDILVSSFWVIPNRLP